MSFLLKDEEEEIVRPHHTRTKSSKDDWQTPPNIFRRLDDEYHFTIDAAANDENHLCKRYYTEEMNGLEQSWQGECVFVNPPYCNKDSWIEYAYRQISNARFDTTVVMLIPDTTDTKAWHKFIFPYADEIRFTNGRIAFIDPILKQPIKGNPRGSAIIVFRTFRICGGMLGTFDVRE